MIGAVEIDRFDRFAGPLEGPLHRLALLDRNRKILLAVHQQHRHADLVGILGRRDRVGILLGAGDSRQVDVLEGELLQAVHEHVDVRDRREGGGAGIEAGLLDHPHERRIAAIAASDDADAGGIGQLLVDKPPRAVGDVVLHGKSPLSVAGLFEGGATAVGTAELRLQHAIAAADQELHHPVEVNVVMGSWTAMRQDHEGNRALGRRHRQGHQGGNGQAVARLVADLTDIGDLVAGDFLIGFADPAHIGILAAPVDQPIGFR